MVVIVVFVVMVMIVVGCQLSAAAPAVSRLIGRRWVGCQLLRPSYLRTNTRTSFLFSPLGEPEGASYSYLSASTGFRLAALQLCQLTVSMAIT